MIVYGIITVCLFHLGLGLMLPLESSLEQEHDADVTLSIDDSNHFRSRRHVTSLPDSTTIYVTIKGDNHRIPITRNYNIDGNLPVYIQNGDTFQRHEIPPCEGCALYQSSLHHGSFLLHDDDDSTDHEKTEYKIFGSFYINNTHYVIQPSTSGSNSKNGTEESQGHSVFKVPKHITAFDTKPPRIPNMDLKFSKRSKKTGKRHRRQLESLEVELLFVTDYSIYQFWYNQSANTIDGQPETVRSIQQYYSYVLNGMDVRFQGIVSSQFSMRILGTGIIISDTASKATWAEKRRLSANGTQLDTSVALEDFTDWLAQQTALPSYDHAMAFTSYNLVANDAATVNDITGLAYIGTICTNYSTSVVEESLNFVVTATATHELGHSLGAEHDGTQNACSYEANYIMSPVNSIMDDERGTNMWKFSNCSVKEITNVIVGPNTSCLRKRESTSYVEMPTANMADVYGADYTCALKFGKGSYVCRTVQNYTTMCKSMYCNKPGRNQCFAVLPAEGTPCGANKWCEKGVCVTSPKARSDVTDDCPIGDIPGLIGDTGVNCSTLVANNHAECYIQYVQLACCKSCNAVRRSQEPANCQYGDRFPSQCSKITRYSCYDEGFVEGCCDTCRRHRDASNPGCEYGDKLSGCLKTNCNFYSKDDFSACCDTCRMDSVTSKTTPQVTAQTPRVTTESKSQTTTPPEDTTPEVTAQTPRVTTESKSQTTTQPTGETLTSDPHSSNEGLSDIGLIAIATGGGALLLIIVVVVICYVARRRREKTEQPVETSGQTSYDNPAFSTSPSFPARPTSQPVLSPPLRVVNPTWS